MATNISGLAAFDRLRLEFAYDYQGRRFSKTVYNWSVAETNFVPTSTNLFIYDGWNLLAELDGGAPLDPLPLIRSYTWGLDLADSFEEAGGIGGLLIVRDHLTATNTYHFPAYDGNGNVTGLVQSSGTPTAIYEYSPFGELIRSTGPASLLNPFQFSTKYLDPETGLSYYGHRYYSASLGRWISRDPIEEEDGPNVYAFVRNQQPTSFDALGLTGNTADTAAGTGGAAAMGGSSASGVISGGSKIKTALNNLDRINDIIDVAIDVMDFLPNEMGIEFLQSLSEFRGDAMKDGLKNGHTNKAARGQLAHRLFGKFVEKMGGRQNVAIGNGRGDGILPIVGEAFDLILELKPKNKRAIRQGKKQLKEYLENYPNKAVGVVITY